MGISLSFYNKNTSAESSKMTYGTAVTILEDVGLFDLAKDIRDGYAVSADAGRVLRAFESFLAKWNRGGFGGGMVWRRDQICDPDSVVWVRQMLTQYHELRKAQPRRKFIPKFFGGA